MEEEENAPHAQNIKVSRRKKTRKFPLCLPAKEFWVVSTKFACRQASCLLFWWYKSFQKKKSWLYLRCMRSKTACIIAIISQENTEHQQKRQRIIMIRAIFRVSIEMKARLYKRLNWKAKNATDRLYYISPSVSYFNFKIRSKRNN